MGYNCYRTTLTTREAMDEYMSRNLREGELVVARNFEPLVDSGDTVGYYALRQPDGSVHALIMLGDKEDGEVCIKTMDETAGPVACGASKKVLDSLTPVDDPRMNMSAGGRKRAGEWRQKCREHRKDRLARQKALRSARGGTLTLTEPLSYGHLGELTKVRVATDGSWRSMCGHRLGKPAHAWRYAAI